nr:MAG TPA: zinc-ribbon containing domain protein [Caudoviricetes sp.]
MLIFNYSRCPDCGAKTQSRYHDCVRCGRDSVINWPLTLAAWITMILSVIGLAWYIPHVFQTSLLTP